MRALVSSRPTWAGWKAAWNPAQGEVGGVVDRDRVDRDADVGRAGDRPGGRGRARARVRRLQVDGAEVDGGRAVERRRRGRAEAVDEALGGAHVDDAVAEDGPRELGGPRDGEGLDLHHLAVLGDGVVDAQVVALHVARPHQAGALLAVERGDGAVAHAQDVGVAGGAVGHLGEGGHAVGAARELEDVRGVLDDVDVDVAALQRVDAGAGVDRVLVLVHLDDAVALAGPRLVAAQVVQVQPVGLAALAGDDADALDVAARELGGQDLERAGAQVLVGAVQRLLLEGHEEVDQAQAAVVVDGHVHGRLLQRRGRVAPVDGDGAELRRVAVARGEEDGAGVVRRQPAAGHPHAAAGGGVGHARALGGEALDHAARGLVPAHDPAREVVLHAVRREAGVDVLAAVQQGRPLVVDAAVEDARRVVARRDALEVDGEVGPLAQVVDVQRVEVVAAVGLALGAAAAGLVRVRLGGQVQRVGRRVDDARRGDADERVDVDAAVQVGGQEGDVQVARCDDLARLGVQLVDVVLGGGEVDVLHAVGRRVDQRLREDLLGRAVVLARQLRLEDLGKLIASHYGRVHVVVSTDGNARRGRSEQTANKNKQQKEGCQ
ncbi:hypothetical protein VTK73DRAFT_3915 [Phialemonium thermophilum]|uniref:Uncharacterized protein n=1 Tax=Phialemonium thermophilum TaxID=223376 RepID=A0ABR3VE32_9PEZI